MNTQEIIQWIAIIVGGTAVLAGLVATSLKKTKDNDPQASNAPKNNTPTQPLRHENTTPSDSQSDETAGD